MDRSVGNTPAGGLASSMGTPYPTSTPAITPRPIGHIVEEDDGQIDWAKVDHAMEYFADFDVVELAAQIVEKALSKGSKGSKEIYNEAGPVRYQMAQSKKVLQDLMRTIGAESLESKLAKVAALERTAQAKSWAAATTLDLDLDQDLGVAESAMDGVEASSTEVKPETT